MMEVALFGAGRIGKIHAGNVARQAGVKLRYVIDVDGAAAAALAAQHNASVASAETALADPTVGAVVIGSSTDTHADLIMRAADAAKAIEDEQAGEFSSAEELVANAQRQIPLYFHRWDGNEQIGRRREIPVHGQVGERVDPCPRHLRGSLNGDQTFFEPGQFRR